VLRKDDIYVDDALCLQELYQSLCEQEGAS
jgi:hypothetical protein